MHSPTVAAALRADGTDAVSVAAEASLRGMSDEQLFETALETGSVIVTENARDFAVLAARRIADGASSCGLVFTSPRRFNRASAAYPGAVIDALRRFLAKPPIETDTWTRWL